MPAHRLLLLRIILLAVALVFVGRLTLLQLVHGAEFREASRKNHLRWVRSPATRGRILDCKGRPLATCIPALAIWLVPGEVPRDRWNYLLHRYVALGIYPDVPSAAQTLAECRRFPGYLPIRLLGGVSMKDPLIARCEEELPFLPGTYIRVDPVRAYPEGCLAAQTIGYLAEIDADELKQRQQEGYRMGDRIGKTGVERAFENDLRGVEGGDEVEVDACGRKLRESHHVAQRAGTDITLTLDLDIQLAAERAMQGHQGAAVALDPATGNILALVSEPAFDLNAPPADRSEFNKAIRGQYPPGSVFKIVTAAAGLEAGKITPDTYVYCDGEYKGIRCWDHAGHGALDLTGALEHSCNVFFMHIAEQVGVDALAMMARRFGLGQRVNIDGVVTGKSGTVPDMAWAKKHMHGEWMPGETLQMGMGQSSLTVTPLQSARIAAAIANGGKLVQPRLIARIGDVERPVMAPTPIGLHERTLLAIERGLRAVVTEGTARQLDADLQIAGKTGTAQNPGGMDHAWFAGYAPAGHPCVAVAVIVEHGGHGGVVAAPIAQAIIRAALGKGAMTSTESTSR
ncbi:MAG TPA: penicillin-binding protein 2 [Armatimonadota bacterium]|nr:penicillin-binding protein 2 [Armatimonadota bacterium]